MKVELHPKVKKYVANLNEPVKGRITNALLKLEKDPPQGDIVALSGQDGFRTRVGDYRILFEVVGKNIMVYEIGLRGQVYKKR